MHPPRVVLDLFGSVWPERREGQISTGGSLRFSLRIVSFSLRLVSISLRLISFSFSLSLRIVSFSFRLVSFSLRLVFVFVFASLRIVSFSFRFRFASFRFRFASFRFRFRFVFVSPEGGGRKEEGRKGQAGQTEPKRSKTTL